MTNSCLIAIVGPTGAGKSSLAVFLAGAMGGEIINFDSVQVYQGLDVGSAKTPVGERQGVPHHLLDVVSPQEDFTAGMFARLARDHVREISERGKIPVLVGGTGFYLRSLLDGLSPAPERNPHLRRRLEAVWLRRPYALHRLLKRIDPAAAQRIHSNDRQKLTRAIELAAVSQAPAPRQPLEGFYIIKLGLNPPRKELYQRLNQRSESLFDNGLLDEVFSLLQKGVPKSARALQSLGYKQAVQVLDGELTVAEAILEVQTETRQYAKRQMTWFRKEAGVHWLEGFGDDAEIQAAGFSIAKSAASEPPVQ